MARSEDDPNRADQATQYISRPPLRPAHHAAGEQLEWQGWEGDKLGRMLANPTARAHAIAQLVAYVERHEFAGVSVGLKTSRQGSPQLSPFHFAELYAVLQPKNLQLSINIARQRSGFRLSRAGAYRRLPDPDGLRRTLVHWHARTHRQPALVREGLAPAPARCARPKMIVAIGNYG